jgi:hypothetical protein
MSSEKFKSKADLLIKIKQARLLLNGRYRDGRKATFELGFKYVRYAIVLFAAISVPTFEYHTKKIGNTIFISYYNLYKIAKILGLEFERNRAAPYAYKELIQRGQVKITVEDNKTFITFTEKGKKNCEEKLDYLQLLNEQFNSNPLAQIKYMKEENGRQRTVKGMGHKSPQSHETETEIDKLIKKISQW